MKKKIILNDDQLDTTLDRLACQLTENHEDFKETILVGLQPRGKSLCEKLVSILGDKYNIGPGGKGCNQAIAIARLGGRVDFISKIGKDAYGELALNTLKKNEIKTENIIQDANLQTGVAGIHQRLLM